jgi:hypothetical protein
MFLQRKLNELRSKPYQVRIRYMWAGVAAVALILILVWLVTLRFRTDEGGGLPESYSSFEQIWQNIKEIKQNPLDPNALPKNNQ